MYNRYIGIYIIFVSDYRIIEGHRGAQWLLLPSSSEMVPHYIFGTYKALLGGSFGSTCNLLSKQRLLVSLEEFSVAPLFFQFALFQLDLETTNVCALKQVSRYPRLMKDLASKKMQQPKVLFIGF